MRSGSAGADLELMDEIGRTPLHLAAAGAVGRSSALEVLLALLVRLDRVAQLIDRLIRRRSARVCGRRRRCRRRIGSCGKENGKRRVRVSRRGSKYSRMAAHLSYVRRGSWRVMGWWKSRARRSSKMRVWTCSCGFLVTERTNERSRTPRLASLISRAVRDAKSGAVRDASSEASEIWRAKPCFASASAR